MTYRMVNVLKQYCTFICGVYGKTREKKRYKGENVIIDITDILIIKTWKESRPKENLNDKHL